jgi:hypothetical protein
VGDWAEYHQCQTILGSLYKELEGSGPRGAGQQQSGGTSSGGGSGRDKGKSGGGSDKAGARGPQQEEDAQQRQQRVGNPEEFMAYRILQAAVKGASVLAMEAASVPPRYFPHPYVRHALAVCRAASAGNYARFFQLYSTAPRMAPYLMDQLAGKLRQHALSALMCYAPSLPLDWCADQLGLDPGHRADRELLVDLISKRQGVLDLKTGVWDIQGSKAATAGPAPPRADGR